MSVQHVAYGGVPWFEPPGADFLQVWSLVDFGSGYFGVLQGVNVGDGSSPPAKLTVLHVSDPSTVLASTELTGTKLFSGAAVALGPGRAVLCVGSGQYESGPGVYLVEFDSRARTLRLSEVLQLPAVDNFTPIFVEVIFVSGAPHVLTWDVSGLHIVRLTVSPTGLQAGRWNRVSSSLFSEGVDNGVTTFHAVNQEIRAIFYDGGVWSPEGTSPIEARVARFRADGSGLRVSRVSTGTQPSFSGFRIGNPHIQGETARFLFDDYDDDGLVIRVCEVTRDGARVVARLRDSVPRVPVENPGGDYWRRSSAVRGHSANAVPMLPVTFSGGDAAPDGFECIGLYSQPGMSRADHNLASLGMASLSGGYIVEITNLLTVGDPGDLMMHTWRVTPDYNLTAGEVRTKGYFS